MRLSTIVVGSLLSGALALPTTTPNSFERRAIAERDLSASLTEVLEQALSLLKGGGAAANEGAVNEGGVC
jgi:hypothetical protein